MRQDTAAEELERVVLAGPVGSKGTVAADAVDCMASGIAFRGVARRGSTGGAVQLLVADSSEVVVEEEEVVVAVEPSAAEELSGILECLVVLIDLRVVVGGFLDFVYCPFCGCS